ncbi:MULTISPECIES: helix-turn-helix domain-containing protein [Lacticaseibacillus]|jgi:DNA-binding XRE family transcriptional regulator|uniref:Transcriptional regulator n=4 Tax=Lacticaseibacillus TaxID=2759736 RepID=A0AAN1EXT4_LACCA|nr:MULTISPECIES: helix-turn-helix transcriptional regulator [Lacticaseibacillus]ARY90538.1 transcriptional regulator [Lacticaseibacillus casei]KAB1970397.1 helix-turn-helix transcriptional regulator [Lacticaseibacillus casei]MDG3061222.1 helix-turn-helix transcriptional regulator [Lacticaseibacillus sp. BCRC 81376]QVI35036.1 helix-turn-helix transcriptional regulator [Lacticaseibacillus chiayiensis]QVI36104.1 helix-turn-helix transcriptional regulator [Lacticaseibacillus casei]
MKIDDMIKEKRKNPEFNKAYEAEGEKLATAVALYHAREAAGLTQAELAERADTTQATIAKIERGDNVSFEKLQSLAHALGKKLIVKFG